MATRSNKRRYVRTRAQNLVAHLRVGDRLIQAPVDDISMGGMLARTNESIAIGTAVMFDLARPGLKKPLRLLGVVVDTRIGRGLGIRFDGLDKEANDRLGDLIGDLGGLVSSLLVDKPDKPPPPEQPSFTSHGPAGGGAALSLSLAMPPHTPAPIFTPVSAAPPAAPAEARSVERTAERPAAHGPGSGLGPAGPGSSTTAQFRTGLTGQFASAGPTENEQKLLAQMRSMVMELGRLQELVQQREKELHDARTEIARLKTETSAGDAAQRIVGKLEIERNRLRQEAEAIQHEAEAAATALGRMLEAVKRLK